MMEVLQEENVILCENSIDFAMKSQNPLDNVHFFDNFDSQHKYSMLKNTVSPMYPDIFQASHASSHISASNACTNTYHQQHRHTVCTLEPAKVLAHQQPRHGLGTVNVHALPVQREASETMYSMSTVVAGLHVRNSSSNVRHCLSSCYTACRDAEGLELY